jgi:hypothetical protein
MIAAMERPQHIDQMQFVYGDDHTELDRCSTKASRHGRRTSSSTLPSLSSHRAAGSSMLAAETQGI